MYNSGDGTGGADDAVAPTAFTSLVLSYPK